MRSPEYLCRSSETEDRIHIKRNRKTWRRQNWLYYLKVMFSFSSIILENSIGKIKKHWKKNFCYKGLIFTWRMYDFWLLLPGAFIPINALADLFAGNSGISVLSRDPLLGNKIVEQMDFDTWYIMTTVVSGILLKWSYNFKWGKDGSQLLVKNKLQKIQVVVLVLQVPV